MDIDHRFFCGMHEFIAPSGLTISIIGGYLPNLYSDNVPWPITSNPAEYYKASLPVDFKPQRGSQYCEVGAALGGFVPWLDSQLGPDNPKPILVIDPLPYPEVAGLLDGARASIGLFPAALPALNLLAERVQVYLDPTKVNLISAMVEDVPDLRPDLAHTVDAPVIELYGAQFHSRFEPERHGRVLYAVEEFLLKIP
jgi:hypothetical protein